MPKLASHQAETVFRNAKAKLKQYLIADGDGLNMLVMPDGSKRWIFRYRFAGDRRSVTIPGGYPKTSAKVAREETARLRSILARGEDPTQLRKAGQAAALQQQELLKQSQFVRTFEMVAREWHKKAAEYLAPSNALATMQRLEKNMFPWIGSRPISELRPPEILAPLRIVEERGAKESAHRILGVCSQIFRYSVAVGFIESDPTRDLRGALSKVQQQHFAAFTDPKDVAGLLRSADAYHGSLEVRTALMLGILTFVRPGNLRAAEWSEFHNIEHPGQAEWRIPGTKMKVQTGKAFIVPLAPQSTRLLFDLRPLTGTGRYLFPSPRSSDRPMSSNAVLSALRRMGYTTDEMTGHGVRAMARTLCHEVLGFAPEVIEEQLAHGKSGPLRGAYDRTTHMPERRRLMIEWANYLDKLKTEVT